MFNVRGKKILVANAPKCSSGGSLVMGRLECALSLEAARSAASVFRKDRVADIYIVDTWLRLMENETPGKP